MERMINDRLAWFLESNGLLSKIQCGFREGRNTSDHLVHFETFIRNAFAKKEHAVSIFFDLEKAHDTTREYDILTDLFYMGLKGKLPTFIWIFLSDREFNVRDNSTYSAIQEQEMGVPQGSILSVTLLSIKINSLAKVLNDNINLSFRNW